jgi:hypothetical protein
LDLPPLVDDRGLPISYTRGDLTVELSDEKSRDSIPSCCTITPQAGRGGNASGDGGVSVEIQNPPKPGVYLCQVKLFGQPVLSRLVKCESFPLAENIPSQQQQPSQLLSSLQNIVDSTNGLPLYLRFSFDMLEARLRSPDGKSIVGHVSNEWMLSFVPTYAGTYSCQLHVIETGRAVTAPFPVEITAEAPILQTIPVERPCPVSLKDGLRVTLFPLQDPKHVKILVRSEREISVEMRPQDSRYDVEYGSVELEQNGNIIV